jgi:tRNA G18 (ribose-2'-O)-methylase SpoU
VKVPIVKLFNALAVQFEKFHIVMLSFMIFFIFLVALSSLGDAGKEMVFYKVDFNMSAAIVIGGEGKGLSDLARKRCDSIASIPMKGKVSSLNASVAAAVVMYEALRQRGLKKA